MAAIGSYGVWYEWTDPSAGPLDISFPNDFAIASLWLPVVPVPILVTFTPTPATPAAPTYTANADGTQVGAETIPCPPGTTSVQLSATYGSPIAVFASNLPFNPYKEVPIVGVENVTATAPLESSGGATPNISLQISPNAGNIIQVVGDELYAASPYAIRLQFSASDFVPALGADAGSVIEIPYSPLDDVTSINWTVTDIFMRAETPGSTTTEAHIEYYTGTGDFVSAGDVDASGISIADGVNESTRPAAIAVPVLASGTKVRVNYASVGTNVAGVAVYMILAQEF